MCRQAHDGPQDTRRGPALAPQPPASLTRGGLAVGAPLQARRTLTHPGTQYRIRIRLQRQPHLLRHLPSHGRRRGRRCESRDQDVAAPTPPPHPGPLTHGRAQAGGGAPGARGGPGRGLRQALARGARRGRPPRGLRLPAARGCTPAASSPPSRGVRLSASLEITQRTSQRSGVSAESVRLFHFRKPEVRPLALLGSPLWPLLLIVRLMRTSATHPQLEVPHPQFSESRP